MGKKVIITGGEQGIGKGIVKALASEGMDVAFSYYADSTATRKLEEEFADKGVTVQGIYADLSKPEGAHQFFESAIEAIGGVDVLINNAGQSIPEALYDLKEESIDYILNLDLRTYLILMRDAAKYMKDHGVKGSIINISSSRGERAYPRAGVYELVKGGLNQAIQCFALDMAPFGIRVNNVAPGAIRIRTKEELEEIKDPQPMDYYWRESYASEGVKTDMWDELGPCIPLGRSGLPEDIANAVMYLISDKASYITGITLRVDGGLILPGMPEDGKTSWR